MQHAASDMEQSSHHRLPLRFMDAQTVSLLVSGGSALVGAIVGAGATLLGASRQHARQEAAELATEQRAEERRKADAREARERDAAERSDELISRLAALAKTTGTAINYAQEASPLLDELSSQAVFLPRVLRERVDEAAGILRHIDDRELHYASKWSIAANLREELHNVIARWLQHESLPRRTQGMHEYLAGKADLEVYYADLYENTDQAADFDSRQRTWRAAHPEIDELMAEE